MLGGGAPAVGPVGEVGDEFGPGGGRGLAGPDTFDGVLEVAPWDLAGWENAHHQAFSARVGGPSGSVVADGADRAAHVAVAVVRLDPAGMVAGEEEADLAVEGPVLFGGGEGAGFVVGGAVGGRRPAKVGQFAVLVGVDEATEPGDVLDRCGRRFHGRGWCCLCVGRRAGMGDVEEGQGHTGCSIRR